MCGTHTPTPAPPHKGEGNSRVSAHRLVSAIVVEGTTGRFPSPLWGGAGVGYFGLGYCDEQAR